VRKTLLNTVAAIVALSAIPASTWAADLPARPPAYAPPVVAPSYNWTGIYLGVNGGWGWGKQDPLNIITNRFDSVSIDMSGGVVGGTAGAQIQSGRVVIGFEADLDWANLTGSSLIYPSVAGALIGPVNASTNISWESTVRARLGYAVDNMLFYMTGGLAILGAKTTLTTASGGQVCGTILNNCTGASRQVGAALGGGVEYGFTPNWSAKLEYLYIGAVSLSTSSHSEVRAGLNYRFGGP